MKKILLLLKKSRMETRSIGPESSRINLRRIYYIGIIAIPVHILHLILFTYSEPLTAEEALWKNGILLAHAYGTAIMLLLFVPAFIFQNRSDRIALKVAGVIQYVALLHIVILAIFIVSVDQLVTTNVTPFLVACTVASVVLLIRPAVVIPVYTGMYILYYIIMGEMHTDQAIILTNRVNGITAVGIGIGLSMILWNSNRRNILQQRRIERQRQTLIQRNQELRVLASHDPLTGLLNRRRFFEIVHEEFQRARRYSHQACIILIDLDHFKPINDKYGHPAGDTVLIHIARILEEQLRKTDILARWGGEEFAVLLPEADLEQGRRVAEKLRRAVDATEIDCNTQILQVTLSAGVALLEVGQMATPHQSTLDQKTLVRSREMIERVEATYFKADQALYRAKERGRNRVEVDNMTSPV